MTNQLTWTQHKRYRHIATLDIDLVVIGPVVERADHVTFLAGFYNRTMGFFMDGLKEIVIIKKAEFHKWTQVD